MLARLPVSAKQPEILDLKACVLSSVLKLPRQNNVLIILFLQEDPRAIRKGQKKVALLIVLGLLLPIHALLVGSIVSGKLWNHIVNRPFLVYPCSSYQSSCLAHLHFGTHYLYLVLLMCSFSPYLTGELIYLSWF